MCNQMKMRERGEKARLMRRSFYAVTSVKFLSLKKIQYDRYSKVVCIERESGGETFSRGRALFFSFRLARD